jgi:hypothetical protein
MNWELGKNDRIRRPRENYEVIANKEKVRNRPEDQTDKVERTATCPH